MMIEIDVTVNDIEISVEVPAVPAQSENPGSGEGDMTADVYDPQSVEADAFSMENMTESDSAKVMTGDERAKLAAIEESAKDDQTGAEIKSLYEAETDTNAFTDAEKIKLGALEEDATGDQTSEEIRIAYESERSLISQVEAEAGSETTVRLINALRIRQAIDARVAEIIDSAPVTLDTLNELAAALGDDPNFAATMTAALAGKQPIDATLTALAALSGAADRMIYFTGDDVLSLSVLTAFARTILDDEDASAVRETLELGSAAESDTEDFEASGSIANYLGPVTLTSANSIAWDVDNGTSANLADLAHDATVTLSNLADGEEFSLAGTQDTTGGRALTIAHSGLTVRGDTSGIAGLTADDAFIVVGRRVGTDLLLSVQTYEIT